MVATEFALPTVTVHGKVGSLLLKMKANKNGNADISYGTLLGKE